MIKVDNDLTISGVEEVSDAPKGYKEVPGDIRRETTKAIQVEIYRTCGNAITGSRFIWVPKSQSLFVVRPNFWPILIVKNWVSI